MEKFNLIIFILILTVGKFLIQKHLKVKWHRKEQAFKAEFSIVSKQVDFNVFYLRTLNSQTQM